jgi:hypothetical protein
MLCRVFFIFTLLIFQGPKLNADQGDLILAGRVFPTFSFAPVFSFPNRLNLGASFKTNIPKNRYKIFRNSKKTKRGKVRVITIMIN